MSVVKGNSFARSPRTKTITGTSHTVVDADDGFRLLFTNAADITVTVNNGLINPEFEILMEQGATGQILFTGTATINEADNFATPRSEKEDVSLYLRGKGSDIYTLSGRIAP